MKIHLFLGLIGIILLAGCTSQIDSISGTPLQSQSSDAVRIAEKFYSNYNSDNFEGIVNLYDPLTVPDEESKQMLKLGVAQKKDDYGPVGQYQFIKSEVKEYVRADSIILQYSVVYSDRPYLTYIETFEIVNPKGTDDYWILTYEFYPDEASMDTVDFISNIYPSVWSTSLTGLEEIFPHKKLNDELSVLILKKVTAPKEIGLPESFSISKAIEKEINAGNPVVGLYRVVTKDDLEKYGITEAQLIRDAIISFEYQHIPLTLLKTKGASYIQPAWNESFKFGRESVYGYFVSERGLQTMQGLLGEEFYIRAPTFIDFVAFSGNMSENEWNVIKEIFDEEFRNSPFPLSNKLFKFKDGEIIIVEDKYPSK